MAVPLSTSAIALRAGMLGYSHIRSTLPAEVNYALVQVRALFSATLPQGVQELASSVLQSPLRLTVGPGNAPTSSVAQRLMFVGREGGKLLGLRQLIAQGLTPPVLLLVSSKERAEALLRPVLRTLQLPCPA